MARPPTPSNWTASPRRWRSTFIRPAPSRSPDSSVAIRNILRPTVAPGRAGLTPEGPSRTGRRHRQRQSPLADRRSASRRQPRQCRQARPRARLRSFADRWSAGRSANPARSSAPSPKRRARRRSESGPATRRPTIRASRPSVPSMSSTADDVPVDHDHGLPDIERAQRAQHVAPPCDVGLSLLVRRRRVRQPAGISKSGATSLIPTMRKPSCSRMRPMPDSR